MGIRCSYHDWRGREKIIAYDFAVTDGSRVLEDGLLGIFVLLEPSSSHPEETPMNPPGQLQESSVAAVAQVLSHFNQSFPLRKQLGPVPVTPAGQWC